MQRAKKVYSFCYRGICVYHGRKVWAHEKNVLPQKLYAGRTFSFKTVFEWPKLASVFNELLRNFYRLWISLVVRLEYRM